MNSSRWDAGTALCVQAVNGTSELKYAVSRKSLFHLMFLFYGFSDADSIDAEHKFMCETLGFAEG